MRASLAVLGQKPFGLDPAFLRALGLETLHGTGPFRCPLGHFAKIAGSLEKTGVGALDFGRIAGCAGRPRAQSGDEIVHSQTAQMVVKPLFFKAGAGGGEV